MVMSRIIYRSWRLRMRGMTFFRHKLFRLARSAHCAHFSPVVRFRNAASAVNRAETLVTKHPDTRRIVSSMHMVCLLSWLSSAPVGISVQPGSLYLVESHPARIVAPPKSRAIF